MDNYRLNKIKLFQVTLLIMLCTTTFAQNLVPNPSFEEYNELSCTFIDFQWPVKEKFNAILTHWKMPTTGTSDVYSLLVPDTCETYPNVLERLGSPNPQDGSNMVGVYIAFNNKTPSSFNYREYVQVELTERLIPGQRYIAGFYQCRANSRFGSNNIGMLFTMDKVALDTNGLLNFRPQVNNTKIENAQLEWVLFYRSFIATEGFRFLTIGNFYKDEETEFLDPPIPQGNNSYYFIDSVFVEPFYDPFIPNIITPNGDDKNDFFVIKDLKMSGWKLSIYNRWGERVYFTKNYMNEWRGEGLSNSVYFYSLTHQEINVEHKGTIAIIY